MVKTEGVEMAILQWSEQLKRLHTNFRPSRKNSHKARDDIIPERTSTSINSLIMITERLMQRTIQLKMRNEWSIITLIV